MTDDTVQGIDAEAVTGWFAERVLSRSVTRFTLAYRDESGTWQDKWDARETGGLPTAVRFELVVGSLARTAPQVIIALPIGAKAQRP